MQSYNPPPNGPDGRDSQSYPDYIIGIHPLAIWALAPFLLLIFTLLACSVNNDPFASLAGKGVLSLSSESPYVGSNLFLATEAYGSSILEEFLDSRGAPSAIQVDQLGDNAIMRLYYLDRNEMYMAQAELDRSAPLRRLWVVRGPYQIPRLERKSLRGLGASQGFAAPVFIRNGGVYRYGAPLKGVSSASNPGPVNELYSPPPTPAVKYHKATTKKQKRKIAKQVEPINDQQAPKTEATIAVRPSLPTPSQVSDGTPLNFDQQALAISAGAGVAPKGSPETKSVQQPPLPPPSLPALPQAEAPAPGEPQAPAPSTNDVIHQVTGGNETLEKVAKWYTGDESQKTSLEVLSGGEDNGVLAKGSKIKVPAAVVKQSEPMPAQ